jgi:CDP-glycerol glycerophosphotransferase (TagB/SpsB family)
MSVLSDLRAARKVIGNAVVSRNTRRALATRLSRRKAPAPGSVTIALYFADAAVNLYQVRQWYAPLAELAESYGVAIITRSPSASLVMLDESPVPVVYCRTVSDIEEFIERQDIRIVLYVNQNTKNFQMFRYSRMWHVFVNHGESDKMYMTTNQFKAYDYAFVAGEAARDRLSRKLWDFDVDKRAIPIGRPQADHLAGELPYTPDHRTVVLYAPTWEGDRPTAAYGSIATHGVALAAAVLASPEHRLIYRPHPRSGVLDSAYRAANERIVGAIAEANVRDPDAQHVFDDGPEIGWQLGADVAITDISAMVYDRLATGRPLLVTLPASPQAELDEGGYLASAAWLTAADAPKVLDLVEEVQHDAPALETLNFWAHHHFGDTTPGAATARFHSAIEQLLADWDRNAALHADDDELVHDSGDPLDDTDDEGMPGT